MTDACPSFRAQLADRLDGLLEPSEAARVDAHAAACPACAAERARLARLASALAAPWEVAEAPHDLSARTRRAFARGRSRAAWAAPALRYAATFAAGALVAVLATRPDAPVGAASGPAVASDPAPAESPAPASSPETLAQSRFPRRIR